MFLNVYIECIYFLQEVTVHCIKHTNGHSTPCRLNSRNYSFYVVVVYNNISKPCLIVYERWIILIQGLIHEFAFETLFWQLIVKYLVHADEHVNNRRYYH